jgi:allophanate hydrolase subunit 2
VSLQIIKSYGQVQFITAPRRFRKFGVPNGGAIDPFTPQLVRSALGISDDSPLIEVMGSITFEAKVPMSICWMTPHEGYVRTLARRENCTITCMGTFAGYLGFCDQAMPTQKLQGVSARNHRLRYLPIEHDEAFEARSTLDASRIGFKFESSLEAYVHQKESEPACVGLIQQTPSGQVIVLGPDGPVTGGYRKLGTVIQADFAQLAMLRLQHRYEFVPVTMDEAVRARRELSEEVRRCREMLRAVQTPKSFQSY